MYIKRKLYLDKNNFNNNYKVVEGNNFSVSCSNIFFKVYNLLN